MIEVVEDSYSRIELYIESTLAMRRLRRLGLVVWCDNVWGCKATRHHCWQRERPA